MSVICLDCEGWGCAKCKHAREAAKGGEQGLSVGELEVRDLEEQLRKARRDLDLASASYVTAIAREHFANATMRQELAEVRGQRDAALTELALLKGGVA